MRARFVLLAACGALIAATAVMTFSPEPDRFPFLKGTARRLVEEHNIELGNHGGHHRLHVRTYALESPRRALHYRLMNELNGHKDWNFGAAWPSPGWSWETKDGSTGLTLGRFASNLPEINHGFVPSPNGYLVTYEPKRPSIVERVMQWWKLHRP